VTPVLQALLALGAGTGGVGFGFGQWRRARAFADTPTSRARSAAQGYAAFSGIARALPGTPTRSPLTGRNCLWYDYRIEERSGGRDERWHTIESGTSDETFALDDGTGQVVIDPDGADVTGIARRTWYTDAPRDPPQLATWNWFGVVGGRYRCSERLVLEGQPLAAAGLFHTQRALDAAGSIEQEAAQRLVLWKRDPQRMAEIDRNHDGKVSMGEWELARQDAREEVARELREQAALPGLSLLQRPADGRPFLIGGGPGPSIARRYRWRALAGVAGGIVLLVLGAHQLGQ
jgi:hypothetical protein